MLKIEKLRLLGREWKHEFEAEFQMAVEEKKALIREKEIRISLPNRPLPGHPSPSSMPLQKSRHPEAQVLATPPHNLPAKGKPSHSVT